MPLGFILEPSYRLERGRAVIELWGIQETGESFLVRDRRVEPYFFIRASDAEAARALGASNARPTRLCSIRGEPVAEVTVPAPADTPPLRDRLEASGVATFDADIRFAMRYLIDRRIRGALRIEGATRPGPGGARVYEDPEVGPAEFAPDLRVLALDIETDPRGRRLYSVALHSARAAEVIVVRGGRGALPEYAREVAGERELLEALAARVRALDPDILSGWNVISFDLAVLERRARDLGCELVLGRGPAPLRVTRESSFWTAARARVEGRAALDGVDLMRGAFVDVEDYRLETVARALLGEGKTIAGSGRAAEIERLWREDAAAFCAYNLKDAELVSRILETTGLVRLAVRRSLLTGMPLQRVAASIASFDSLYLPELRRRGFVAPSVRAARGLEPGEATAGGAVLEPVTGLHANVLAFDFRSLYPSLMLTFNIDPLTHAPSPAADARVIRTPTGVCFAREKGIVPDIIERLLEVRAEARRRGDPLASQATKILMNSFYGVLATPACRFHSSAVANAITGAGQALLFWTKARVEELGHRVLYGDTDSLFVSAGLDDPEAARRAGVELAARLNRDLADHLRDAYGVESRLELQFEIFFLRLFFPQMRHGAGGARKRYAGLAATGGRREVVFVGMESVRRDWTEAAKEFQRGLYGRVFAGDPVEAFVREFVASVTGGGRDAQLVYKKALRKPLEEYTATTPPHVKAARLEGGASRLIEYVVTTGGPEPLSARQNPLDYDHYVEKQLRPIAEAILPWLGLEWDAVVGKPRQMGLF